MARHTLFYRCHRDITELIGWLPSKGVVSRTPLHTLRVKILTMRKSLLTLAALLLIGGSALADTFRVHYSIRGSGRDITVQAESSAEARRTVMDMFPGAVS